MIINNYINLKWFIVSFALGLFLVYCTAAKPTIIIKYPTPENSDKLVFEDDVENCYKFNTKEVSCPKNKKIPNIPIQKTLEHFKKNRSK
uniref:Uncharacterized protein n=1 Tax=viral metagenome TaxID=1070528 RepID=A0A6C0B4P0_9ZZZZ